MSGLQQRRTHPTLSRHSSMKYIKLTEKRTGKLIDVPYNAKQFTFLADGSSTIIKWIEPDVFGDYYKTVIVKESESEIKRKIDLQRNELNPTK